MTDKSELWESPQTSVEWKIKNFFDLPKEIGFLLEGPIFVLSEARWYLRLFPNGELLGYSSKWLGLYLEKEDSSTEHHIFFKLEIKNADGSVLRSLENQHTFQVNRSYWGWSKFFPSSALRNSKNTVAPNGILTVVCSIRIVDKLLVSSTKKHASETQPSLIATAEVPSQTSSLDGDSTIFEDFKNMYITGNFTDVTILVKNEKFCTHRNVLASRSTVFAAMFQHDLIEKNSGKVEISDCNPDSFEVFLLFLYTGKLGSVSSRKAVDLYKTADKYDVKQLKEQCVEVMRRDLCVDSFCNVIQLATMHLESDLLKVATDFFIENVESILKTTELIEFTEENAVLTNELFMNYVKSKI